jgi:ribonucleoside-diphosphate reductase alpha chain
MSTVSEVIEQGGSRRGANLGLLEVWHPDIWEYIGYKSDHNWDKLRNFMDIKDEEAWTAFKFENLYKLQMYNISVGITDEFLKAVNNNETWPLLWNDHEWELYTVEFKKVSGENTSVKTMEVTADSDKTAIWKVKKKIPFPTAKDIFNVVSKRKISASEIWNKICFNAWDDGCPGLINLSTARRMHNLEYVHPITSTNPCGEQPLGDYGSCNLSSLILSSFVVNGVFQYTVLKKVVRTAVRFADNIIDNCEFPVHQIKKVAREERRVGLGTMGVHDMLIKMGLGYDTEEGRTVVAKVLETIRDEAYRISVELAKEKGVFPLFDRNNYLQAEFIKTLPGDIQSDIDVHGIRNSLLLSQAPTGTIATLYSASSGCEPWFSLSFQRNTRLGSYEDGCPGYIEWKKNHSGEEKPSYFKTAQEISPGDHIKMMTLFSKYMDSAVSKTINLPNSATVDDVKKSFMYAMENGVKGITVFRDGSKEGVLVNKDAKKDKIITDARKTVHDMQNIKENSDTRMQPKKRGIRTIGATYRIPMQGHHLYVTVNRNNVDELVEIFATVGESKQANPYHTSGVEDSWAEGLGKMISLCLRAGVKPQSIIRNLKNIPSDKPVFYSIVEGEASELIPSPPHAVARVIEEEMRYYYQANKSKEDEDLGKEKRHCAECGSTNLKIKSPTCYECNDCSYSGCG